MAWSFYNSSGKLIDGVLDSSITNAKMASDSIDSNQYVDGSIDTAHIAASQITNALMADDAVGIVELSATGTASSSTFLRGDNAWVAAGGPSQAAQSAIEAETNEDTYAPPDLIKHSPGVAKAWCRIASAGTLVSGSYNVASITDTGTGDRTIVWDTDFSDGNYSILATNFAPGGNGDDHWFYASPAAVGSVIYRVVDSGGSAEDQPSSNVAFGDQ